MIREKVSERKHLDDRHFIKAAITTDIKWHKTENTIVDMSPV